MKLIRQIVVKRPVQHTAQYIQFHHTRRQARIRRHGRANCVKHIYIPFVSGSERRCSTAAPAEHCSWPIDSPRGTAHPPGRPCPHGGTPSVPPEKHHSTARPPS